MAAGQSEQRWRGIVNPLQDKTSSTGVEDRKTKMAFLGWRAEEPKVRGRPGDGRNERQQGDDEGNEQDEGR